MADGCDVGAVKRKHRRRATGVLDPPTGYDATELVECSEVPGSPGPGWPAWPSVGPGIRPSTRRRFVAWGVGLLVLMATCGAVDLVSGPAGPPPALMWVLGATAVAWIALPAGYLTVLTAVGAARGTLMRPCVHCGLSIGGQDEWCRFCRTWQVDAESEPS